MSGFLHLFENPCRLVGFRQVEKTLSKGQLDSVVVACDVESTFSKKIRLLCARHDVKLVMGPSKRELGKLCGIGVSAGVVGFF